MATAAHRKAPRHGTSRSSSSSEEANKLAAQTATTQKQIKAIQSSISMIIYVPCERKGCENSVDIQPWYVDVERRPRTDWRWKRYPCTSCKVRPRKTQYTTVEVDELSHQHYDLNQKNKDADEKEEEEQEFTFDE